MTASMVKTGEAEQRLQSGGDGEEAAVLRSSLSSRPEIKLLLSPQGVEPSLQHSLKSRRRWEERTTVGRLSRGRRVLSLPLCRSGRREEVGESTVGVGDGRRRRVDGGSTWVSLVLSLRTLRCDHD
ncbi:hypothetical protein PIB30_006513 [Stylosanthes scabra]|uniref:Uncharacterized protein n=1 Tax=Stylosanthes scabra TaxID=79078 RepID=A0ABU6W7G2_9FABA|nr:hypothetical protein [Stylosanthes scabra]